MSESRKVVIVGGGIAGLTAAYALWKVQVPFTLCEAGEQLGGVIRSESSEGFLLEAGPDSLLAQKPEGLALCRELGLGPRLQPTNTDERKVYIVRNGRLHALPDGLMLMVPTRILPFLASSLFSWAGKLRMARDLAIPRRRDGVDESIADFMRRRFGQEALDLLGEPLMAGIHSGDPEKLSMRATFPRFVELEARYGSLVRGMLAARRGRRSAPAQAAFYSLKGGLAVLVSALSARLPAAELRTGARTDALGDPVRVHGDGLSGFRRQAGGAPAGWLRLAGAATRAPAQHGVEFRLHEVRRKSAARAGAVAGVLRWRTRS